MRPPFCKMAAPREKTAGRTPGGRLFSAAFFPDSRIMCTVVPVFHRNFTAFLVINGLVGAAEASFTIIAPSIIADMYVGDRRSRALSCYYGVAFIGSGLGYIDGSKVTSAASGDWRWAFRISPALGMIGVLLMFVFVKEPTRGAIGGNNSKPPSSKTWISDVKQLLKNWSFVFCTLGMTAVKFAAGAIGFHALTFLKRARDVIQPCQTEVCDSQDSLIFGGAMVIAGICGVVSGVEIAKRYSKYNPRADPIVCASGMLCSAIFLYFAIFMGNISLVATYVCLFLGILCLTLNCSVSAAIRLNVVPPASRSTAEAIFMIVSDLLGAAGSSYIIGLISDHIKHQNPDTDLWKFHSLQYALMVCPFVLAIGGGFFFGCALFIEEDRKRAETESEAACHGCRNQSATGTVRKKLAAPYSPQSVASARFILPSGHR
ncbi:unnamed protein product [Ranitomeya imitator]|uniref:Major facilitator superfamily (MFS) profile domain-containing protein n=1 Tax=Ranitomeya imitator TaxID=111125 RepID=A0ABN9L5U7_9NEOB|nr:unnamed protein product [Ranitomeya imitator]